MNDNEKKHLMRKAYLERYNKINYKIVTARFSYTKDDDIVEYLAVQPNINRVIKNALREYIKVANDEHV